MRVIEAFQAYLGAEDLRVTRAEFERNLAAKARNRLFIEEVTPMLAPGIAYDARTALEASACCQPRLVSLGLDRPADAGYVCAVPGVGAGGSGRVISA